MEGIIVVCPAYRSQLRLEELRFADVLNMVAPFTLHKRRSGGQTIATRWINPWRLLSTNPFVSKVR